MKLLQLSAGSGPAECQRAVFLATRVIQKEARNAGITLTLIECVEGDEHLCFRSVLFRVSGVSADVFIQAWCGALCWVCKSPFRPFHKRKNWFFDGEVFDVNDSNDSSVGGDTLTKRDVMFTTCRASGAGGQHVNKTNSAVQATHTPTGISVRVESERSQHANKRLALLLLAQKRQQQQRSISAEQQKIH